MLTIPNSADAAFSVQSDVDSRDFDAIVAGFYQTGVVGNTCAVTQRAAGANLSVDIAAGTVSVAGVTVAVGATNLAIAADPSLPRFGLILVNSSGTVSVTYGTAAAAPVFPTYSQQSFAILAAIYIPAAVASITTSLITDKRVVLDDVKVTLASSQTVTGAKAFTGGLTTTLGTGSALSVRSGASGSKAFLDIGRTAQEASIGVAAGTGDFTIATAAGETIHTSAGTYRFGISGTERLSVSSTGAAITGSLTVSTTLSLAPVTALSGTAGTATLSIGGQTTIQQFGTTTGTIITDNAYYNGTSWIQRTSTAGMGFIQIAPDFIGLAFSSANPGVGGAFGSTTASLTASHTGATVTGVLTVTGSATVSNALSIATGATLTVGTRLAFTSNRAVTTNASDTVDIGTFSTTGGAIEVRLHCHLAAPAAGSTASVSKIYEFAASSTMGTLNTWYLVLPVDSSANVATTNDFGLEVQRTAAGTFKFRLRQKSIGVAGVITYLCESMGDVLPTFTSSSTVTAAPTAVTAIHPSNGLTVSAGNVGINYDAPSNLLDVQVFAGQEPGIRLFTNGAAYCGMTTALNGNTYWAAVNTAGSLLTDSVNADPVIAFSSAVTLRIGANATSSTMRITASDVTINDGGTYRTVPRGLATAPVQVTTPFSTTTTSSTIAITGASSTFSAVNGRWYFITFTVPLVYFSTATAVSMATTLRIIAGSSAPANNTGTQIQDIRSTTAAVAGSTGGQPHTINTWWQATSTGSWTIAAFAVTAGTAGTYNWTCGATSPMNLTIENAG